MADFSGSAPIDQISSTQANKELTMNALTDAASPAMIWGRHASATFGLTWGYYGGRFVDSTGTAHAIANGAITLGASTTTYIYADNVTGAVSSNMTGFPAGKVPLYSVVTGASAISSWLDYRSYQPSAVGSGSGGMGLAGGTIKTAAYTFVSGDKGQCLIMNSSGAVSQQLNAASFGAQWWAACENIGAGTMTLTVPTGTKLDGVTNGTLAVPTNNGVTFFTDGTDVYTIRGIAGSGGGGGMTNPMTTAGDIIIGGSGGTPQRLGIGSTGQVMMVASGAPAWASVSGAALTPFVLAGMASSTQYKPTGGYTVGTVLVVKNGSLLTPTIDFTATDGVNVNFSVAVKTGDQMLYIGMPSIGGAGTQKDAQGFYLANYPTTSGFTLSQSTSLSGNASMNNLASGRGFNIVVPCQSSADNNAFVNKAVPGGSSWTMTAMLVPMVPPGNASNYSLAVQDASGKIVLFGFDAFAVKVTYGKWASINSFTGRTGYSAYPLPPGVPVWMKLSYTSGGNFVFSLSADGETFAQMLAISVTDYISTPSVCGVWVDHNLGSTSATTQIAVSVMSFAAA
ncbi:hypothetical protein ABXK61_15975 [Burkholderia sola]|uniref:hypothetical protein n=1 Tax=Burkholderia TaxID=32008 RepID=UPI001AE97503|nr:hypothetical protein [Burkholderia sp. AcTa6-5]MBP0714805.1 hypothetical protein [Burkholderia sp. AcTa6-5]